MHREPAPDTFPQMMESTAREDLETALAGAYTIVRETPQTAGFSTFSARSVSDGSTVEIKAVPVAVFAGSPLPAEADLAARRVQHPNIVPVLGAGRYGSTFYWISAAIEGRTLRARLSRGGRMAIRDSLIVLRDISAALTHAHLHGIVHGGLSPDSILISGGSALLGDLGVAEVFAALRRQGTSGTMIGSRAAEPLRYSAPEQASGARSDTRSDVYAWGAIGYELLSGRHPFAGRNTPREIMAAHSEEEPVQLTSGRAAAPAAVTRLVMRCLAKDPSSRPESARECLAVMTKEMLVPPKSPPAGSGQKMIIALGAFAVLAIAAMAWISMNR
ncbi:MAG TPA: serine/threonine-protein kinase [Gemmatimonadaceae bacterium]|nr:serine/threonine-protein kinase [Gemmatimonadaceae bacterium]